MTAILNQKQICVNDEIMSLALYNFACFTSFYVYRGEVKGLDLHLNRLLNDANALFGCAPKPDEILANVKSFLSHVDDSEGFGVRVTIFPANFSLARPTEIKQLDIMVNGRSAAMSAHKPLKLLSIGALRSMPGQKTVNMTANFIARGKAQTQGADDALMIDDQTITEGPTWNIFFGKDNILTTPSLTCGILPGITRKMLIESAQAAEFDVVERNITVGELGEFDFCFASNALIGVKPVCGIDQNEFDTEHPALTALAESYRALPSQRL